MAHEWDRGILDQASWHGLEGAGARAVFGREGVQTVIDISIYRAYLWAVASIAAGDHQSVNKGATLELTESSGESERLAAVALGATHTPTSRLMTRRELNDQIRDMIAGE